MLGLVLAAAGALVVWMVSKKNQPPKIGDPEYVGPPPPAFTLHRATLERVLGWRDQVEDVVASRSPLAVVHMLGLVALESSGRENAFNSDGGGRGAWGLTQIRTPALTDYNRAPGHQTFELEDMHQGSVALEVGAWYLHQRLKEFGNIRDALRAYKAGPTGARRGEGQGYADTVLKYADDFRRVLGGEALP